jgi:hypothetical protein
MLAVLKSCIMIGSGIIINRNLTSQMQEDAMVSCASGIGEDIIQTDPENR